MSFHRLVIRRPLKTKEQNLRSQVSYVGWALAHRTKCLILSRAGQARPHLFLCISVICLGLCGCDGISGYSNESLFPEDVRSVCLEMFDNQTFRRGVEYELSDALAKCIEVDTPYKIVSDSDRADTVMSGQIVSIGEMALSIDREVGTVLEKEVQLQAVVSWKNLKTGQLLIDHINVSASASYSEYQQQDFKYASSLAANNLARKIVELMDDDVALVMLFSVLYRSGQLLDMQYFTQEAHRRGIIIGFDCSHSAGVVPHHFDRWDIDFAVWCSYKYLNSGPGSTAFLYVNKKHFERTPALAGWFGYVKEKQFDMLLDFEPAHSAGGWQISSPGILSAAPIEGALQITLEAGIEAIREKSLTMTSYLMYLIDEYISGEPYRFTIGTPRVSSRRGGHVAIEHQTEAFRITEALKARGVISDFRFPNVIRIAPVPLYNTYCEIWRVVHYLKEIFDNREYEKIPTERKAIT